MAANIERPVHRARLLLASSSVAALLVGCGGPAIAACYTGPFTGGYTNSGATPCITVNNTSFTGALGNTGTIAPGPTGIAVVNHGTITGQITDSGTISASSHGILIDRTSAVSAGAFFSTIAITGPTFSGGISNSGSITGNRTAILVAAPTFLGGISNSGMVTAFVNGIQIRDGGLFSGGVSNSGTVIAASFQSGGALTVSRMPTFVGGITNSGIITGSSGIFVGSVSTFTGGITNSGTISSLKSNGIGLNSLAQFSASGAGGGITNTGSISAFITGISVYNNISTFSGGITNAGTISAAKNGIGLSFAPTANKYGTVSNFSGNVANAGTIAAAATGIGILASTFTGNVTNSGTISAGKRGIGLGFSSTGSFAMVYGVSTFSGNVSNSGTITAATGIYIGAGVNFAGGGAVVNSGTITGTRAAIDASQATSPIIIDQNAGLLSGNVLLSANADVLNINGGTIAGNIIGSGASDTVNFQTGGTYTETNTFTGINQVNINSSMTFVLNSTGNSATNVDVGAISGGALAGTGSIAVTGAVTLDSGGVLLPGSATAPLGTFTITGGVAFDSGSGYGIRIAPGAGNNSATDVNGTATLGGNGTVIVKPALGHYAPTVYTIMTTPGPANLIGQFADLALVGVFSGTMTLDYVTNPGDVDLDVSGYGLFGTPAGAGANQQNVVNGLNNYIFGGGTLPTGFANLGNLSGPAYLNALTQLDGEAAAGAGKGASQLMTDFLDLMFDMSVEGRGGGGGAGGGASGFSDEEAASLPPDVALAYSGAMKAPPKQSFEQRWNAWASAFGGTNKSDGDPASGSSNVAASSYGFAGGMDYHVTPQTLYGFALAGGGTNWNVAQNLGSGRSDAFQAGVYGITHAGPAYLSGALAFANHWFTTSRIALGDDLTAKFQGQSYAARGEVGYRYAVPLSGYIVGVTPYAALQAQDFRTPSYGETDLTGGGLGLRYSAASATDTRSELGARFDNLEVFGGMPLVLRARAAWAHDWISNPALGAVFQALPGSNFTVNGAKPPQDSALTSAAAELHINANWTASAKFDGEFASTSQTYAGTGTLKYSW